MQHVTLLAAKLSITARPPPYIDLRTGKTPLDIFAERVVIFSVTG